MVKFRRNQDELEQISKSKTGWKRSVYLRMNVCIFKLMDGITYTKSLLKPLLSIYTNRQPRSYFKLNSIMKSGLLLLICILLFAARNGQDNDMPLKSSRSELKSVRPSGRPKLVKTQGSTRSDNIYCSLQDRSGNLWFGTTGEGVYEYDGRSFTQYTKSEGLISNTVYSLLEDASGSIWIGTSEGLCRLKEKKIERISYTRASYTTRNENYYTGQSTANTIWSLFQDKSGKIWFGTGDGVYQYDGSLFVRFLENDGVINKENLQLKLIDQILQDKNGNVWFASGCPPGNEGVCRYDGRSISSFKPNGDSWVRYIKEDKKGNLWFGGRLHGNFLYDGKTFTNFTEKSGIGNPLLVDKTGNIWFSGEERSNSEESKDGIWAYNGNAFKNYSSEDGMSKYFTWSMLEDRAGNIWIGTRNTELYRFDGKVFTRFSE